MTRIAGTLTNFEVYPDAAESRRRTAKVARSSGTYWFEFKGQRTEFGSLKDLLSGGLRALEEARPGTLEKLSQIKPRSKRVVARDSKQLFDKEHLAEQFSERLADGWWYGTNNSKFETEAWLARACACSGLTWGMDFKTNLI